VQESGCAIMCALVVNNEVRLPGHTSSWIPLIFSFPASLDFLFVYFMIFYPFLCLRAQKSLTYSVFDRPPGTSGPVQCKSADEHQITQMYLAGLPALVFFWEDLASRSGGVYLILSFCRSWQQKFTLMEVSSP